MLDFDNSFFKEEIRCNFTIPSFMKHAWAAQLELYSRVKAICEENEISFFVDWGTLLGTIRHKGYIPWDDDIDLCMKRNDLKRFTEVINNYEGLIIQNCYTSRDHGMHASRVLSGTKFSLDRNVYKQYHGFPFPVGLDIFALDYVPRDKALEAEQIEALRACSTAIREKEWLQVNSPSDRDYSKHLSEYRKVIKWLEKTCNMQFSEENPSEQEIVILNEEISGLYSEEDADYLTEMPCIANGRDYYIPKEDYESQTYMAFENVIVPVPNNYDFILRKKYGDDYMTPQIVSAGHEYPFYNAFVRNITEEQGYGSFEETFEYIDSVSAKYYVRFINKTTDTALTIPENKIYDEVIGDELVSSDRKRMLAAKCEVLEEFKKVCQSIDVTYYAIGEVLQVDGSLKNPRIYNQDIHLAINRTDLDKLVKALGEKLDPWFNYSTIYTNDNHDDLRISVYSDGYLCEEVEFARRFHGCCEEVAIDISVIDTVLDDDSREETRKTFIESLITTSRSMPIKPPYSKEILSVVDEWKKILGVDINTNQNLKKEFLIVADTLAGTSKKERGVKVRITSALQEGRSQIYDRSDFEEVIEMPFGYTTISLPKGLYDNLRG